MDVTVPGCHVEPVADDAGDAGHDEGEAEGGNEDRDDEGDLLSPAAEQG